MKREDEAIPSSYILNGGVVRGGLGRYVKNMVGRDGMFRFKWLSYLEKMHS